MPGTVVITGTAPAHGRVETVTRDTGPLLGEGHIVHRGGRTATAGGGVTAGSIPGTRRAGFPGGGSCAAD